MTDPFRIEGPAVVSFSGGRTSGYMLRRILDEGLASDVHVLFADTGKERPETYAFVHEIERRWSIPIHWVSRPGGFQKLIEDRRYLPNPVTRMCTGDLKVKPMKKWMLEHGYEFWTNVIGLRADEPHRVSRMRGKVEPHWDYAVPLADAKVTEADVLAFWTDQAFDLQLETWEGNCDLCFLKGKEKKVRILMDHPELAQWWLDAEQAIGATFRKNQTIRDLVVEAQRRRRQVSLPVIGDTRVPVQQGRVPSRPPGSPDPVAASETLCLFGEDDLGDCLCTD